MEAVFFLASRAGARGVASSDDLPDDAAASPLRMQDPSPLAGLAHLLGVGRRPRPLRDATCRSFPVWDLGGELAARIAGLGDAEIDDLAEAWQKHDETGLDADLYELAECLADLRDALQRGGPDEALFALLEERVG